MTMHFNDKWVSYCPFNKAMSVTKKLLLAGGVFAIIIYVISETRLLSSLKTNNAVDFASEYSTLIGSNSLPVHHQVPSVGRQTVPKLTRSTPAESISLHVRHRVPSVGRRTVSELTRSTPTASGSGVLPTWYSGDAVGLSAKDLPNVTVTAVNCNRLFRADGLERQLATKVQFDNPKSGLSPETYSVMTSSCSAFIHERRYAIRPTNIEEADFPIAYSILMFKDVEQFERLLRAIYRPQNVHCIHVDAKSSQSIHQAVDSISRCFENIFVLKPSFDVRWGTFTVLDPEIQCMKALLLHKKKWKYFINLTGQEFPLKTNWQIVQILKAFNGSNNMEGTVLRRNQERTAALGPPPVNVTLTKGSVHIAATREFVDFAINNEKALKLLDWLKTSYIPDETFFSSLNHSPQLGVPGSYMGVPETDQTSYWFLTRFKNWGDGPFNWPCYGKRVSMVCIFSVGDLALLASRPELFANKFYLNYEPLALDCMEQLHFGRLENELSGAKFDTSFYENQSFVKNRFQNN